MRFVSLTGLVLAVFLTGLRAAFLRISPVDGYDLCGNVCFFLFWYLLCGTGEGHGRRARMALDRIVEMFGTSWMPAGLAGVR